MTEATYDHIAVVKELCEYVGADYETAINLTIQKDGSVVVEHVTQRKPYLTTEVRTYSRIAEERFRAVAGGTA